MPLLVLGAVLLVVAVVAVETARVWQRRHLDLIRRIDALEQRLAEQEARYGRLHRRLDEQPEPAGVDQLVEQ